MKLTPEEKLNFLKTAMTLLFLAAVAGVTMCVNHDAPTAPPFTQYDSEINPDSIKPVPLDSVSVKVVKEKKGSKAKPEKKRNPRPFLDQPIPKE